MDHNDGTASVCYARNVAANACMLFPLIADTFNDFPFAKVINCTFSFQTSLESVNVVISRCDEHTAMSICGIPPLISYG